MSPTSYLISGANRGIGFALVQALVHGTDQVIIFAGARDLTAAFELNSLATQFPSVVIPVQLKSADVDDAVAAAKLVEEKVGSLDVLIANAGISRMCPVATVSKSEMLDHLETNAVGPLVLYQAFRTLLLKSTSSPRFVPISSAAGSLSLVEHAPIPIAVYGASKAAVNYYTLKIHQEEPGLIAFPLSPGMVDSDMGLVAKAALGDFWKGTTPASSAAALLKVITTATREETSGKFMSQDGTTFPW